ncbi:hypothetical protein LSH36_775g00045 [Paralvinella palmiformis]|uniref:G-protein coupled receptors family 1 profile domain-containing protein n=1 Tax=Paralvinella palmiformis TaxID=53620 RepID=A0AAD9MSX4_9ANNE|nr:hypothetical protein LSH36_775g00045 [Paralvinella palmiformis]
MAENASSLGGHVNRTSDYPPSFYIALHIIGIPLGIAIIVGNVLLVIVLKLSSQKQQKAFKSKTAFILANIALCDAVGGLFLVLYIGIHPILDVIGRFPTGCYFWNVLSVVPLLGGFLLQLLLAIERHVIVNEIPNYPHMNKLVIFLCLMWIYTLVVSILGLAFISGVAQEAFVMCDILTVSPMYLTTIVFVHVTACAVICTVLIFIIRNTVKHHQCKIQVSNTIAYTNLIEDSQIAKTFFGVSTVSFLCWLLFFVSQILIASGIRSSVVLTSARWGFLLGHLSYLKCFCYMVFSRPLREDFKRTLGKSKKRPFRMGTIVRE